MQNDTVIKLTNKQHDDMLKYVTNVYMFLGGNDLNMRAGLEWRDRVYYRETDWTKDQLQARLANFWGDAKKMQNVTVPVVAPHVETMVGYLAEVFCTGHPFYGVAAPKDMVDGALHMETVVDDNSRRFGWRAEYIKCFRDGLKYNIMAMEKDWKQKKVFSIINDPAQRDTKAGTANEEMYAGNFARRVDLYNIILDTRVRPNECHRRGEFSGYVDLFPRTDLKQFTIDLGTGNTMNLDSAFQSNCGSYMVGNNTPGQYYIPLINPLALINQNNSMGTNWSAWLSGIQNNGQIEYRDLYEVAVIYARFMPSDFGLKLPAANTPQIFKLIVVNKRWIIFCQRMTNAHNFLPIIVGQPFDDGLGYQAKSYGDNVTPYQELASSLWNSGIESKRRMVYDRLFYDPSRVSKTDIDRTSSVARIAVKPGAYGKPVGDAVHATPYRDDNIVGIMQMAQQIGTQMPNTANGTNNAGQGQFQKGNKTKFEFETVMARSDWHPRLLAMTLEDTWFGPLKEITKMNVIQYQGAEAVFNVPKQQMVDIDPQVLRKSIMQFKLTDGMTPSERILNLDIMGQVAQLGMAVPEINLEYDITGMFLYMFKMQGATWLDDFKRTPEQIQQRLQMTNAQSNAAASPEKQRQAVEPTPPAAKAA